MKQSRPLGQRGVELMFGKSNSSKELQGSSGIGTVIGPDTTVQGTVSAKSAIRIDGKLEGGVIGSTEVVIGEGGEVQGDITAGSVIVGGRVIGNIVVTSLIELLPKSRIHGDIKAASLSIAEGAIFEGNCTMMHEEKQIIEMNVSGGSVSQSRK